jgi:hypothetical protein
VTTYPYTAARYDFGPRKGPTLGLLFHGAEAESGVVGYLSRDPARGVSANFVCERSGRMVRMLPYNNASGSLNPNDRSTDKAYYGHSHLVDVLGDWWRDPNSAVVSVEIEMYAKDGPTIAQVAALIAWSKDMRSRFPSIRGALGHADQTDTKGCPGTTANMKLVFSSIGGHGLWQEEPMLGIRIVEAVSGVSTVKSDAQHYLVRLRDGARLKVPSGERRDVVAKVALLEPLDAYPGDRTNGYLIGGLVGQPNIEAAFILATDVDFAPTAVSDCSDVVAVARDKDRAAVLAKVAEVYP